MQQTEKYKFNLIETSDPFSPEALNKNMETLETELARLDGADAALAAGQLVYKIGKYTGKGTAGSGNKNKLTFDFSPIVLFVCNNTSSLSSYGSFPWIRGQKEGRSGTDTTVTLTWDETSVSWYASLMTSQLNRDDTTYYYIAIGLSV